MDEEKYIETQYNSLIDSPLISLVDRFPRQPGVYVFIHGDKIIYAGETSNLERRIYGHRKRTEQSTLRRAIADKDLRQGRHKKYPSEIEKKIDAVMVSFGIRCLPIKIGRSELEEYILLKHSPRYNTSMMQRGKEKAERGGENYQRVNVGLVDKIRTVIKEKYILPAMSRNENEVTVCSRDLAKEAQWVCDDINQRYPALCHAMKHKKIEKLCRIKIIEKHGSFGPNYKVTYKVDVDEKAE